MIVLILVGKENFVIAIDGPSASGKGTVASMLAQKLGIMCLDTGALYRGLTIHFMQNNVDIDCDESVSVALESIKLEPRCVDGVTHIFLNGVCITQKLHDVDVSVNVYKIAPNLLVRKKLRDIQHSIAVENTLVCEGRDITSVVFPDAKFKFYLDADLDVRAKRRHNQELAKGSTQTLEQVKDGINKRDIADMTRDVSPLVKVCDAYVIDASYLTPGQIVDEMMLVVTK